MIIITLLYTVLIMSTISIEAVNISNGLPKPPILKKNNTTPMPKPSVNKTVRLAPDKQGLNLVNNSDSNKSEEVRRPLNESKEPMSPKDPSEDDKLQLGTVIDFEDNENCSVNEDVDLDEELGQCNIDNSTEAQMKFNNKLRMANLSHSMSKIPERVSKTAKNITTTFDSFSNDATGSSVGGVLGLLTNPSVQNFAKGGAGLASTILAICLMIIMIKFLKGM